MKTKTIAVALVITITGIFLTRTFLEYYEQIQNILFAMPPAKLIASFLLFLGYFYMRALSWRSVIYSFRASISKIGSFSIWFFSEATRYIPGNIWSFVSRAYLAQQRKIPRKISIFVLPIEVVIVITTTTILSLLAILKTIEKLPINITFYILIAGSLATTLAVFLLQKQIKIVLKKLLSLNLVPKPLFFGLIFQFVAWSLYCAGNLILIESILYIKDLPLLFSSTMLSWLFGYLSIVTPMGIGVRESAFVLLAGPQIGPAQAAAVAILSRTILIVAELTNLAFWAYFLKKKNT